MMQPKSFNRFKQIFTVVSSIPYGKVATYGQIADMVPICSARLVGFALASLKESHENIPWHRVVNRNGEISARGLDQMWVQKELLKSEGIEFSKRGTIDFRIYGW